MNETMYIVKKVRVCFIFFVVFILKKKKKKGCLNKRFIYLMDCLRQMEYIKSVSITFIENSWLMIKTFYNW